MRIFIGVVVMVVAAVALAGNGQWSDKSSFRYTTGGTSLKVAEPEGFKIAVVMPDGNEKTGTVPEMFTLPDADAFVKITMTAPDGAQFSKKIEIRAKQQTELVVQYKADPAQKAEPANNRSFVGKFLNAGNGCGTRSAYNSAIKVDFVNGAGTTASSTTIDPNAYVNLEITSGKYDVRVFRRNGELWDYVLTTSREISKDGWVFGFGCVKGSKSPTVTGS